MKRLEESGELVVFLEAAILIEAGWFDLIDELWVSCVPLDVAKERIMERNGLNSEQALSRIHSQISNQERISRADVVIDTNRPKEQTEVIVKEHYQNLMHRIRTGKTRRSAMM
eukprot:TRINITY_DN1154_c0_g1_i40.p2 TRINITY_DN1154_c0_g1~~TRINITY_DN1154_c0_g1_i40.p2  ORF type:complete len:113 (+),score=27.16 TRINITY_DN1154_c0_g1_i40:402-740(+)